MISYPSPDWLRAKQTLFTTGKRRKFCLFYVCERSTISVIVSRKARGRVRGLTSRQRVHKRMGRMSWAMGRLQPLPKFEGNSEFLGGKSNLGKGVSKSYHLFFREMQIFLLGNQYLAVVKWEKNSMSFWLVKGVIC